MRGLFSCMFLRTLVAASLSRCRGCLVAGAAVLNFWAPAYSAAAGRVLVLGCGWGSTI